MDLEFNKTILPNGSRVVTEKHPNSRAVSCGIMIATGSRDETPENNGICHFLEHTVFKGTKNRSALQLAKSLEAVGGELNAYTTKEYTCYHALCLKDHLELALDVLFDLVLNASFPEHEMKREKKVVLQEILMGQDNPEEYIFDLFFEEIYRNHPVGYPIIGKEDTVQSFSTSQVKSFYKKNYAGQNMIVTAAGNVDHQTVIKAARNHLGRRKAGGEINKRRKPRFHYFQEHLEKDLEQTHLVLGFPTTSFTAKNRFEAFIANALLGGGMTSKLYQAVREKTGLVYSVYSTLTTQEDSGICSVYLATEPNKIDRVLSLIQREFDNVRKRGVRKSDLELFKTQVKGSILLSADDIENRMNSLGVNEMVFGKYRPVEKVVQEIEEVNLDGMNKFIKDYVDFEAASIMTMGEERKTNAKSTSRRKKAR
jgi:predicted Zn-dependent peptidase